MISKLHLLSYLKQYFLCYVNSKTGEKYNLSLNKWYHQPDLKTARAKQHINEVCEENISGSKNISVQFQKHMSCQAAIILWWLSINGMKNLNLKKKLYQFLYIYDVTFASLKYSSSYLLWIHFIVCFCINLVVFHPPATLSNSIDFDILIICATKKCLNSGLQNLFQSLIDDYLHLLLNNALLESKLPYSISMFPLIVRNNTHRTTSTWNY